MSFALSSIVRTRQKKYLFSLVIFILLFFCPLFHPSGVQASEAENIDSMDVFPSNRWTITNNGFDRAVIDDGLLNMTDIGDGSVDGYRLERNLRDLDGIIEFRFKHTGGDGDSDGRMELRLVDTAISTAYIRFLYFRVGNTPATTVLDFKDSAAVSKSKTLSADESVYPDIWYTVRIDFDIPRSNYRTRMYFDNGSKVFDYSIHDIHTDRPVFFASSSIQLYFNVQSDTNNEYYEYLLDYFKAPFKEREWTQIDTPGDAQYVHDGWDLCNAIDDVDDTSGWSLTVPSLDAVSGEMVLSFDTWANLDTSDYGWMKFSVYGVDADDGGLHLLYYIRLRIQTDALDIDKAECAIFFGSTLVKSIFVGASTNPAIQFQISLKEDRSVISLKAKYFVDSTDIDMYEFITAENDVSDEVTDPSNEFLLRTEYDVDFTGDVNFIALVSDFEVIERDIWSDVGSFLDDLIGLGQDAFDGGAALFSIVFRWLADTLLFGFQLIVDGLQLAFETALGAVETAIGAMQTALDTAIGAVQTAVEAVTTAIGLLAEEIMTALVGAIDDIIAGILILAEDFAELLFAVIDFLLDLILDIVDELWGIFVGMIFFAWNFGGNPGDGLPDVLALGSGLLAYFIELIDWTLATFLDVVQLADDLSWIILVVWWFWALPIQWARAEGNPLAGLGNFIEVYFYDAMPWSVFGFHLYIPQGLVFTLWMILLLPETFILFTALGL